MKKLVNNNQGFTLAEVIVALGIFTIVMVSISDLFIRTNRAQRRTQESQTMQSDGQLVLSQIVDRFRSGTIDYTFPAYTPSISGVQDAVSLLDEFGNNVIIRRSSSTFSSTVCPTAESTPCIEISEDGGGTFFPMSSADIKVTNAQFFLDPPEDPLTPAGGGGFSFNIQPRLTVALTIQNTTTVAADQRTIFLQTSVTSRQLLR